MLRVSDFINDDEYYGFEGDEGTPVISVIMPIYCHNGDLLCRAIESVLTQTFSDFELIIIDDGSRDGSFDTALEYANKDKRVKIIRHRLNCGLPAIRVNEGILKAKGKYIAYQFDDDEYLPRCLEILYKEITQHEEPCLVYGKTVLKVEGTESECKLGAPFNYALLNQENQIANNSVLHHKSVMDISGMYDPHIIMRRLCDHDLWLRMGKCVPIYFVEEDVTNVYAGQKGSLGADVGISSYALVRKYLETFRDDKLLPSNIESYDVDSVDSIDCFNGNDKDFLRRVEVIPFISKSTYYLNDDEKVTFRISRNKVRNILAEKIDYSTSIDVTLKNHLTRCNHIPYSYSFCKSHLLSAVNNYDYDLIALYRSCNQIEYNFMKYCQKKGISTAYFSDDNMLEFYKTDPEKFSYLAPGKPYYENTCKIISEADCVISYSKSITKSCSEYSNRIIECSTNIPAKYIKIREKKSNNDRKIRFGIFSGNVRKTVFAEIWDALVRFTEDYSDRVEFEFWGIDPCEYEPLSCNVKHIDFTHSYDYYLNRLSNAEFDFQICPLENIHETDKSKSPIKYLEGVLTGAVGIFSNVLPYRNLKDSCCIKTGNSVEEWYNTLVRAIKMSEDERYEIYLNAVNDIRKHYTSEAHAINFLTALDASVLHGKLKRQKIAFIPHESLLGGATLHIFRHLMLMKSLNFDVVLCLPQQRNQPDLPNYASKYGIEVEYIPCRCSVSPINRDSVDYENAKAIVAWAKQKNIGLFHSVTYNTSVALAAEMLGIPHVATLHQYYKSEAGDAFDSSKVNIQVVHSSSNRYALEWNKILGVPSYRMVCPVSDTFFSYFEKNVVYNVENTDPGKRVEILISGTLQPRKNQLGGIKAAIELISRGYDVHVSIIGYDNLSEDYVQECRSEINNSEYFDCFDIVGFTSNPERFYNGNAQILLCPAFDESMPQTILQAMASGVFVVSTNCGGVSEIIKSNYNGFLTSDAEPESIANTIEHLLKLSSEERTQILDNAHSTMSAIGTEEYVRSELVNIYNMAFENLSTNGKRAISNDSVINKSSHKLSKTDVNNLTYLSELNHESEYELVKGGRNLVGHTRVYEITMRTQQLDAILVQFATESFVCSGKIKIELSMKKTGTVIDLIEIDASKINFLTEYCINIVPITASCGDVILMKVSYITSNKREYICIYEKRKKPTLINRIKYKLNLKSSYRLAGKGVFK